MMGVPEDNQHWMNKYWFACKILEDGIFGAGCVACAASQNCTTSTRAYARYNINTVKGLQKCNLLLHHGNESHRQNVITFLGLPHEAANSKHVIPKESVRKAWDMVCAGQSPAQGLEGVGRAEKVSNILWCISEAIKHIDRNFVQECKILSMRRYERNHGW